MHELGNCICTCECASERSPRLRPICVFSLLEEVLDERCILNTSSRETWSSHRLAAVAMQHQQRTLHEPHPNPLHRRQIQQAQRRHPSRALNVLPVGVINYYCLSRGC